MPDEPENRVDLVEVMLGIAIAVIVAPGVIWWLLTSAAFVGVPLPYTAFVWAPLP
jgi:heme/copper-type cytochrome/quinol oxidase subunit 4